MKLRTEIENITSDFQLGLTDSVLTIGSCFADVIGEQLSENKIDCLTNLFGTVFNPVSLIKLLKCSVLEEKPDENSFVENSDGSWNHYDFHSSFRTASKAVLEEKIISISANVLHALKKCQLLIITLGTANVYQLESNGKIVSNCHKQPQQLFEKRLLSTQEIETDFFECYGLLKQINPKIKLLLTVSPVRHTRDGLRLNSISKSILRTVCHDLCNGFSDVLYFPSYEIMVDDLRDYRFYKTDLIHPNEVAEAYIFDKFSETYFSDELQQFTREWGQIRSSLQHRPFNPASPDHQKFLEKLLQKVRRYANRIDVSEEIKLIEAQLVGS